jgi:hypothetical protein
MPADPFDGTWSKPKAKRVRVVARTRVGTAGVAAPTRAKVVARKVVPVPGQPANDPTTRLVEGGAPTCRRPSTRSPSAAHRRRAGAAAILRRGLPNILATTAAGAGAHPRIQVTPQGGSGLARTTLPALPRATKIDRLIGLGWTVADKFESSAKKLSAQR